MFELPCYIDLDPNVFFPVGYGYLISNIPISKGTLLQIRSEPFYKLPMIEIYEAVTYGESSRIYYFTSSFNTDNYGSHILARSSVRSTISTVLPRLKTPLFIVYEAPNVATLVSNPTFSSNIDASLKL